MGSFDVSKLPSYIDHTLLKADAGEETIRQLCAEAKQYGFYSVCVNGTWVSLCKELLAGSGVKISVVCGFPLGAMESTVKAWEAAKAAEQGADEIDMVLQIGRLKQGEYDAVREDIRAVVQAVEGKAIVKVIFETGSLNEEQKLAACRLSVEAGAHYVKTSTGFGQGGATVEDIRLMRGAVPAQVGVKASGGVRDLETAIRMIEAGATRLGTSSGVALMQGTSGQSAY
ncbi:deoxyribose-phosphate aldolase [Paenibacillus sp. UNCCL117]|uniref:deoxyribose-phosphate aldolase n=1 Tax=unclassified Paenibacillus TaxID=185978 RepID=UPI00088317B4|nr:MULTISPECIES: deoxyribose-phosphate aldolase [unclassified Paenibacillus]SDC71704.1 deoxyribose-phosphate aldolase [Paenibacillus sp. cl123]SFW24552.1 deoxyribose-phosphate aldolase [Paenibacillus sp. UNCCL117]